MMSLSLRLVTGAACLALLAQPVVYAARGRNKEKEEKLTARIERERNPGKKARLQLRLAKMKMKEADGAYHDRNFDRGQELLGQYLGQIRDSWATLQGAKDGVRKHLGAFKDLEISLRENDRFLRDLSRRVPYPESETVKKIAKESSAVHNQVLEAIFPSGPPPNSKGKHVLPLKNSTPSKPVGIKS